MWPLCLPKPPVSSGTEHTHWLPSSRPVSLRQGQAAGRHAPPRTPRPCGHRLPSPASLIPRTPGSPAANPQNARLHVPIPSRAESLGGWWSLPQHGQPSCRLHTYAHESASPAACLPLSGGQHPSCTAPRTRGSCFPPHQPLVGEQPSPPGRPTVETWWRTRPPCTEELPAAPAYCHQEPSCPHNPTLC